MSALDSRFSYMHALTIGHLSEDSHCTGLFSWIRIYNEFSIILLVPLWAQVHILVMQKALERYLLPDARQMVHELTEATGPGFRKLNDAVSSLPK